MVARDITLRGLWLTNCSNTGPRIMAASAPRIRQVVTRSYLTGGAAHREWPASRDLSVATARSSATLVASQRCIGATAHPRRRRGPPVNRPFRRHSALIPPKSRGPGRVRLGTGLALGGLDRHGRGWASQSVQAEAEEAVEGAPGAKLVTDLLVEPQRAVGPLAVVVGPHPLPHRASQEGDHLVALVLA